MAEKVPKWIKIQILTLVSLAEPTNTTKMDKQQRQEYVSGENKEPCLLGVGWEYQLSKLCIYIFGRLRGMGRGAVSSSGRWRNSPDQESSGAGREKLPSKDRAGCVNLDLLESFIELNKIEMMPYLLACRTINWDAFIHSFPLFTVSEASAICLLFYFSLLINVSTRKILQQHRLF